MLGLIARHCGFGRHLFANPSELLAPGGWPPEPRKPWLSAAAVFLELVAFSSVAALAEERAGELSTALDVSTKARLPIWRTTTLGSYKGVNSYRDALDAANIKIGDAADEILGRPAFPYVGERTDVEVTLVAAAELGVKSEATLADVYSRAKQRGLMLCPPEVALQLRLDYRDQPIGESLTVAMEPVKTYSGEPTILSLVNFGSGLALLGGDGRPEFIVHRYLRFVFALPTRIAKSDSTSSFGAHDTGSNSHR